MTERPGQSLRVEMSGGPLWRLVGVVCAFGALAALGYWLNIVDHVDDFATIASVALVYTLGFWADKRPDKVQLRFGPFSKIAIAIRDSRHDIQKWVYDRPLIAGFAVAVVYGVLLVLLKIGLMAGIRSLSSPWLAVAVGGAIGAVVVAPQFFGSLGRRLRNAGGEDRAS